MRGVAGATAPRDGHAHGAREVLYERRHAGRGRTCRDVADEAATVHEPHRLGGDARLFRLPARLLRAKVEVREGGRGQRLVGSQRHGGLSLVVHDGHEHAFGVFRRGGLERPFQVLAHPGEQLGGDARPVHVTRGQGAQVTALRNESPSRKAPTADQAGRPQDEGLGIRLGRLVHDGSFRDGSFRAWMVCAIPRPPGVRPCATDTVAEH